MRRTVLLSVAIALAVLLVSEVWSGAAREARALTKKPNIVFIIADDMRFDDLRYMPKTRSALKDRGMAFQNAFVSTPQCCPSRATIMRGQYAHNTGVWNIANPDGGWQTYRAKGLERDNVATRLHDAGYRTGLFGKYLNGYGRSTTVPPKWDDWFAFKQPEYYNYDVNDNGTIRHFGTTNSDYSTDVLKREVQQFIGASAAQGKPFFAYVTPYAPHRPATAAPRDRHTFDQEKAPRLPSFNEADVSDKPPWIQSLRRLTSADIVSIDQHHENRVESLQAVDDLVAGVVGKLRDKGVLSNTYLFFTSDNGFQSGEHRIPGKKGRPYEESVNVPLLVRGPGVAAGRHVQKLVLNTDYLPTFTDLGDAKTPGYADGRSLQPVLEGNATTWRSAILLEADRTVAGTTSHFSVIRTSSGPKYVRYAEGKRELYYLGGDPYELRNSYDPNSPPTTLATRLNALKTCSAASCRKAENGQ